MKSGVELGVIWGVELGVIWGADWGCPVLLLASNPVSRPQPLSQPAPQKSACSL